MAKHYNLRAFLLCCGAGWLIVTGGPLRAEDAISRQELQTLQEQNRALQQQLRQQQGLIDSLTRKVNHIQLTAERGGHDTAGAGPEPQVDAPTRNVGGSSLGQVRIGGEGGVVFWKTGSEGMSPQSEFRLDEARLFVESPVVDNVYFYGELNLATREEPDVELRLGEAYLEFEDVSRLWGRDRMLNLRLGRVYTPFGEEYQNRYAIDNPLISHSLSDLWSVDEGLELYGCLGKVSYAFAVQNGGIPDTADFNSDKSLAGRVGFDPSPRVHLSVSAMRTGDLNVHGDQLSAMWFGNAFFRSLGSSNTTHFGADLVEGDLQWRLPHGHLHAFGGYIHYDDNDSSANNRRDVYYYSLEGVHELGRKFYAGARFSQIFAHKGFPILADGQFGQYFFGSLTEQIWRLSLGVGYRWSQNLVLKAEYSFEGGKTTSGENRDHEDLFGLQAAFKF
jgi:hypothetical protein